jgi:hypothetical protein
VDLVLATASVGWSLECTTVSSNECAWLLIQVPTSGIIDMVLSGNNSSIFVDTIICDSLRFFGPTGIVVDEVSCDAASAE